MPGIRYFFHSNYSKYTKKQIPISDYSLLMSFWARTAENDSSLSLVSHRRNVHQCHTHDHPESSSPNGPFFTEARYADMHAFTLETNSHNPTLWAEINTEKWSLRDAPLRSEIWLYPNVEKTQQRAYIRSIYKGYDRMVYISICRLGDNVRRRYIL